jgi:hypothetical protein
MRIQTSESSAFLHRSMTCKQALIGSDDSDDEDETAALMAELAKIKQERAEEKARQVSFGVLSF